MSITSSYTPEDGLSSFVTHLLHRPSYTFHWKSLTRNEEPSQAQAPTTAQLPRILIASWEKSQSLFILNVPAAQTEKELKSSLLSLEKSSVFTSLWIWQKRSTRSAKCWRHLRKHDWPDKVVLPFKKSFPLTVCSCLKLYRTLSPKTVIIYFIDFVCELLLEFRKLSRENILNKFKHSTVS